MSRTILPRPSHDPSRRAALRRLATLAGLGAGAPLALNLAAAGTAVAAAGDGYRALVCVFLNGGNDSYNTVLATDSASWSHYRAVRRQAPESIALAAPGTAPVASAAVGSPARLGGVLPIHPATDQGRSFALHPMLTGVRDLFDAGRLAIVANVGPLLRPTSKADWFDTRIAKPAKLFSHNDQQSTWQTLGPEGTPVGWGGRIADQLAAGNRHTLFTAVSASGNAVWLAGERVLQYQVSASGAIRIAGGGGWLFGSPQVYASLRQVMRSTRGGSLLERDHAAVAARSMDAEALLTSALPAASTAPYGSTDDPSSDPLLRYDNPLTGAPAANPLAQQLQIVARMIGARSGLGSTRQVFFVSLGGFDTHDRQNRDHADLMARLSHGLAYFDAVLGSLGIRDQVTTFTASDFGRTFTSNGDGTDHGWGAHHLVMGGAVRGGEIVGRFPTYGQAVSWDDFGSPDQIGNGAMLPAISVDQYGATLARWLGAGDGVLNDVFPHLGAFDAGVRDLGFMA